MLGIDHVRLGLELGLAMPFNDIIMEPMPPTLDMPLSKCTLVVEIRHGRGGWMGGNTCRIETDRTFAKVGLDGGYVTGGG